MYEGEAEMNEQKKCKYNEAAQNLDLNLNGKYKFYSEMLK